MKSLTAKQFIDDLKELATPEQKASYNKSFKSDEFIGVRMGQVFNLAKAYMEMDLAEVEKLLESYIHEARVGAVSIMDYKARQKNISDEELKAVFDLYIRRHDRINSWDLVDRSAIYVVGGYLNNHTKDMLYTLAKSEDESERRTAIVSTAYFMKEGKVEDTFNIAEVLLQEENELVQKATGWMLRVAGDVDWKKLEAFLDKHAATMPRAMLRNAIEKCDKTTKEHYMKLKSARKKTKNLNTT